jgi:pyridoxal 5'-phosphate synthase subunit Pdx1
MVREINLESMRHGTTLLKRGFAKMQKGGVVMDVTTPEQARIAEEAGAVAVMALERVPADIRKEGGVARMSDPAIIAQIVDTVTIPVMAKARIGHIVEARVVESLGVDMIDESEVLTPADPFFHTWKRDFTVPFVSGARTLGEATRRVWEGSAMIRTKGEAGTGDIVEAVRHRRTMMHAIQEVSLMDKDELLTVALSGNFQKARDKLDELLLNYGLSGEDIVRQIHRTVFDLTILDKVKDEILERVGENQFRLGEGANECIQIESLLARVSLTGSMLK